MFVNAMSYDLIYGIFCGLCALMLAIAGVFMLREMSRNPRGVPGLSRAVPHHYVDALARLEGRKIVSHEVPDIQQERPSPEADS